MPHHGRLRQGHLKTLCDKLAVSELSLFATSDAKSRCRTCFGKVDEHGYLKEADSPAKPDSGGVRRGAKVIPLPEKKKTGGRGKED